MSWKPTFCAPVAASPESWLERVGEIAAGEAEERHESRRQRAAIVEEVVERIADVELVDAEGRRGGGGCAGSGGPVRAASGGAAAWRAAWFGNKLGHEVEHCGIAGVAQTRLEAGRQAEVAKASNVPVSPPAADKMV